jgi:hypothetical protein
MSHTATVKTVPIKSVSALVRAVEELKRSGVHCELERNAIPRMYYVDQIQKHLSANKNYTLNPQNGNICDFVLRLPSCFYDVAFVKTKEGHYEPVFDNFIYPSPWGGQRGHKSIAQELGATMAGAKQQQITGSGAMEAAESTMLSIGKFLQEYSKCAAIESAEEAGYTVLSTELDSNGNVLIEVEVN